MNPFAAAAVKVVGGGVAATLLSLGVAGGLAQAATPSPHPAATANPSATASHAARRAVARAVFEAEADVLGIKPAQLREDLKAGQKVSDLAKDKGMTKEQFTDKLLASLRPRLKALVDHHVINQAQAGRVIDRISKGHIPFWDGIRPHKR
jgi:hypothetical protein